MQSLSKSNGIFQRNRINNLKICINYLCIKIAKSSSLKTITHKIWRSLSQSEKYFYFNSVLAVQTLGYINDYLSSILLFKKDKRKIISIWNFNWSGSCHFFNELAFQSWILCKSSICRSPIYWRLIALIQPHSFVVKFLLIFCFRFLFNFLISFFKIRFQLNSS